MNGNGIACVALRPCRVMQCARVPAYRTDTSLLSVDFCIRNQPFWPVIMLTGDHVGHSPISVLNEEQNRPTIPSQHGGSMDAEHIFFHIYSYYYYFFIHNLFLFSNIMAEEVRMRMRNGRTELKGPINLFAVEWRGIHVIIKMVVALNGGLSGNHHSLFPCKHIFI